MLVLRDGQQAASSTFTTLAWNGSTAVSHLNLHLNRLKQHAQRLLIQFPPQAEESAGLALKIALSHTEQVVTEEQQFSEQPLNLAIPPGLCRLSLDREGQFEAQFRPNSQHDYDCTNTRVTALPAPRWDATITGTKHGDWEPYQQSTTFATENGFIAALLVHAGVVVDSDRATPLLLDVDGTAWYPDPSGGAVDSITLQIIRADVERAGIPLQMGRLTTSMFERAVEVLLVGTGLGVSRVRQIDGQPVGSEQTALLDICRNSITMRREDGWEELT
jgi:branched-subunit amino acid aminotransferase/4-amino-4-deoxychorismate lyase